MIDLGHGERRLSSRDRQRLQRPPPDAGATLAERPGQIERSELGIPCDVIGSARKADMGIEATAEAYAAAMKV